MNVGLKHRTCREAQEMAELASERALDAGMQEVIQSTDGRLTRKQVRGVCGFILSKNLLYYQGHPFSMLCILI